MGDKPTRTLPHLGDAFELRYGKSAVLAPEIPAPLHVPAPSQRLLAMIALRLRPAQRRTVAQTLGLDSTEQQAGPRSRVTFGCWPASAGSRLVTVAGGRLALADEVKVDMPIEQDDARTAQPDVNSLCGDGLPDWSEDWVAIGRERLHRPERLPQRARQQGRFDSVLQAVLAVISIEPLRGSAHRQVTFVLPRDTTPSEAAAMPGDAAVATP